MLCKGWLVLPVDYKTNLNQLFANLFRDTEYYDYGHGEAQDTAYESYSK